MRRKRTILMLVAVMLLCAMTVSAVAANLAEPAVLKRNNQLSARELTDIPEIPEVTVEGNMVSNDNGNTHTGYFELSVYMSAKGFQSVGVVLSYDTAVLQPVDWATGDAITVSGKTWNNPTVLHTKGADALSGKPALAYTEYKASAAEGDAGAEQATGRANLYLGADALQYTDLSEERVVTVRFKVAEKADGSGYADVTMPTADAAANGWSEPYTVQLADSAVAQAAIPGSEVFVTVRGEDDVEPKAYAYQAREDGVEACATQFRIVSQKSINQTSSIVSGDYAITFFDWDGRVIDAISAPEDAGDAVAAWEQHAVVQARLGNKPGYEFDKWLVVYEDNDGEGLHTVGGTFTSNDTPLAAGNPDVADLSDISGYTNEKDEESRSVLLQASYKAKTVENGYTVDLVNGGGMDNTDRYYTISEPVFTRYGAADAVAGSYSLTMTVTRRQENGETGVTRLREPAIWVAMAPEGGGANILNLIRLENTDETTFEIVTTKQISSVTYKVIDVYGISNWPGCADRSDVTKGVRDRNTCITRGTQGYLAEQAYSVYQGGTWEATVNNWAFADCYYNNGTQSGKAAATWWTDARCATAKSRLLAATQAKGAKLTYDEVLTALGGVS